MSIESFLSKLGEALTSILSCLWALANSQLFLTLIGTSFAAFAGAYGAHTIIERNKRQDDWQRELRITNAAISVSFEICNSFLSLKKQLINDLRLQYDHAKASLDEFTRGRETGKISPDKIFEFNADFRSINPMITPGEILVKQIFEQISADARAHLVTNVLIRTIDSLNRSIIRRNELIDIFRDDRKIHRHNLL